MTFPKITGPLRPEAEVLLLGECPGSALGLLPYTKCMHLYGTCLSNHMQNNTPDITHTLSQIQAHIFCPNSTPNLWPLSQWRPRTTNKSLFIF
jgi:hypothetical protein